MSDIKRTVELTDWRKDFGKGVGFQVEKIINSTAFTAGLRLGEKEVDALISDGWEVIIRKIGEGDRLGKA